MYMNKRVLFLLISFYSVDQKDTGSWLLVQGSKLAAASS